MDDAELRDTALLLADELVVNAVLHARSPARLTVAAAFGALEVGVADVSRQRPRRRRVPASADGLSVHGRGLTLLEELSVDWGVAPLPVGKQVWFRLETASWPWTTVCPCAGEDLERVRLGSGRWALSVPPPWTLPELPGPRVGG
jgi:hypothetical protein